MKDFLSTPYGDFDFVKSDLSISDSCDQCCMYGRGYCDKLDCQRYDNGFEAYHLRPHVETEIVPKNNIVTH